jgi:PAS domain S-box-containing protein
VALSSAAVLFVAFFALHLWVIDPDEPVFLYALPVAIVAAGFGAGAGVAAGTFALILYMGWAAAKGLRLDELEVASRGCAFWLLGGLVGYFAERLRTVTEQRRMLIESAPDGIIELDRAGVILSVNAAAEKLSGFSRRELVGTPLKHVIGGGPSLAAPPSDPIELSLRRKDARQLPVELKVGRGDQIGMLIVRDISRRKLAEDALRASEKRFRSSLETMLDCFGTYSVIRDEVGRIVDFRCEYVNEAACAAYGLTREEQIGERLSVLFPGYLDRRIFSLQRRIVETGEPLEAEDYVEEQAPGDRNGTRHVLDIRAVKLGDGFAATWRDITERKEAEERLARLRAELERSNRALEESGDVVSHELSEPLGTISLFAQTLAHRCGDSLDHEGRRLLSRMTETLDRMQSRIDALLELARVHHEPARLGPVDCGQACRDALTALERSITDRGARVSLGPLPTVRGHPDQLAELFENLLSNAIKFSGERPRVTVAASREPDGWHFTVSDEGPGMAPEHLRRIFEPFERVGGDDRSGSGIGLAICAAVVERHGGRLWAESQPGQGSTFHFTLPREATPAAAGTPAVSAPSV